MNERKQKPGEMVEPFADLSIWRVFLFYFSVCVCVSMFIPPFFLLLFIFFITSTQFPSLDQSSCCFLFFFSKSNKCLTYGSAAFRCCTFFFILNALKAILHRSAFRSIWLKYISHLDNKIFAHFVNCE